METLRKTWLLWFAFGSIVAGFSFLASGKLSAGPLLLALGYCVLLPFFLWRSFRKSVGE